MQPIFNEYISFLKDKGNDIGLVEGYYWLEYQVIRGYTKDGQQVKIARVSVDENLNVTVKRYNNKNYELETWNETINRNKERLDRLEIDAINMIANYISKYSDYTKIILSSGGKDSVVLSHLVRLVDNIPIIFNNSTLDCADTYKQMKQTENIKIINPNIGFYQWRKDTNFIPTRFARGCCSVFKEQAMIDALDKNEKFLYFMGMRNSESPNRSDYGDIWINKRWKGLDWFSVLPIRTWTDEDIWQYILDRNIIFNDKYKKGYTRVGCAISCPYPSKSTWVLDKYWYRKMYERWHKILEEDFTKNNKALILNCTLKEYHNNWNDGCVREKPNKEVISEFAENNNLDYDTAERYFAHTCEKCNKKIKTKEVIAMNLKYFGKDTTKFFCKKHLMEELDFDKQKWEDTIDDFKKQNCILF